MQADIAQGERAIRSPSVTPRDLSCRHGDNNPSVSHLTKNNPQLPWVIIQLLLVDDKKPRGQGLGLVLGYLALSVSLCVY